MKKIVFFLFYTNLIFSQELSSENFYWPFYHSQNIESVIGVKKCYIRQEPSLNGKLLDSLSIGYKVNVLENTTKTTTINGLNLSWVEIEYIYNSEIKKGFLWKGCLALGVSKRNGVVFLTTIDSKFTKKIKEGGFEYNPHFCNISVKAVNQNYQLLDTFTIAKQLDESMFFENSTINGWGLKNVNSIYRISLSGEACGIPTYHYYFGWTGKKILLLPQKYQVGDAGIFYHTEEFIFPNEKKGEQNTIIKQIIEAEIIDENIADNKFLVKKELEYYSWNGMTFKLIKTKKIKPYIQIEN